MRLFPLAPILVLAALPWTAQAQSPMPQMQSQGDVKYVCGGIGSGASTRMRAAMHDHPLSLMFVNQRGEFMAAVAVTVKNDAGATVLNIPSSGGPICLIDIAEGRYTVVADPQKRPAQTRTVAVGAGPRSIEFRF